MRELHCRLRLPGLCRLLLHRCGFPLEHFPAGRRRPSAAHRGRDHGFLAGCRQGQLHHGRPLLAGKEDFRRLAAAPGGQHLSLRHRSAASEQYEPDIFTRLEQHLRCPGLRCLPAGHPLLQRQREHHPVCPILPLAPPGASMERAPRRPWPGWMR